MASIDLPSKLRAWVEEMTGRPVVAASRHFAGASRDAWNLVVGDGAGQRELFLLCDKGGSGGSGRDASVLRALADSTIPVPEVFGWDEALGTILLARVPGRSDFPAVDDESEREPTARHLMELTGALHRLDPASLGIEHLSAPENAESCAEDQLRPIVRAVGALGEAPEPFFVYSLGWLRRNVPTRLDRVSLVHSDMGPGNFLAEAGRVTGIVDWEVAHYGDPMEDLAAIAIRDMATPMGHLPTRLREYEESSGIEVDLERVGYYRALVLVRNSLMISLGLADPPPTFDVVEMTMYQTLLMRGAALVICDNLGIERPIVDPPESVNVTGDRDGGMIAALRRDLNETIRPALGEGLPGRRAAGMERALAAIDHDRRVGVELDRNELDDLEALLGQRPDDLRAGEAELHRRVAMMSHSDPKQEGRYARYFARRMLRLAERRRPLMGPLFERLPQSLEDS